MSTFPDKEPRLDSWTSATIDEPVEDLSGIAATQPYRSNGPWVSAEALELLFQVADSGKLGRFDLRGNPDAVQSLMAAELLTDKGRLTAKGNAFVSPPRTIHAVVAVSAQHGQHRSNLQIHIGGTGALIAAGPSHHRLLGEESGTFNRETAQLDFATNEAVPEIIGKWMGLGPAWSVGMNPEQLPAQTLEARFTDDATAAPAEADPRFLRMWLEPWTAYTISIDPGNFRVGVVNAGAAGFYSYGLADEHTATLSPLPSAQLWSVLVTGIGHALS